MNKCEELCRILTVPRRATEKISSRAPKHQGEYRGAETVVVAPPAVEQVKCVQESRSTVDSVGLGQWARSRQRERIKLATKRLGSLPGVPAARS